MPRDHLHPGDVRLDPPLRGGERSSRGVENWTTEFAGFDCNDQQEGRYASYARYFCADDRYVDLPKGDNFNSHATTLARYRHQLREWRSSPKPEELTGDDVRRIVAAAMHPSSK